ncbi:Peptidase C39 [Vibrio chagasii]|nr:Peptidase C39 [Vibrio chagasii]
MEINNTLNWCFSKKLALVRQTESTECGIACLAMIADWHGYKVNLRQFRSRFEVSQHGMTLARLIECSEEINLSSRAVSLDLDDLVNLQTPCILHWNLNHFVVLKSVNGKKVVIHDPACGVMHLTLTDLNNKFTGIALELTPNHNFEKKEQRDAIKLSSLIGKTIGLKGSLIKILIFSLVLEVLALFLPMLNQIVIDEVLVGYDENLLILIIISILLVTATQTLIGLAKDWAIITLSINFNMQWTANVFNHLFRLPIEWFEKRNIGSISSKFSAVDDIQATLTTSIITALLDVFLVVGTLIVMVIYSPKLSIVAILAAISYVLLRCTWFDAFKRSEENMWEANTKEESFFLETVRGVVSLRVNGTLPWRESTWKNLNVIRRNTQLHDMKLDMIYSTINVFLISIVSSFVLWIGSDLVLSGSFTVGMLLAFLSYQQRFSGSISSLINSYFEFKMLSVYNERLADIVLEPKEISNVNIKKSFAICKSPDEDVQLVVNKLSYCYGKDQPLLLNDISFKVKKGEIVALIGPSGEGKSTIAKLLLGLYTPTSGNIEYFGDPTLSMKEVRLRVGSVFQEDQLFSGSIVDNITFWGTNIDEEWLVNCTKKVQIHDDIERLNMGYHTLIGEMGSSLSTGQKQRILLARALYKKPDCLILDEATSSLDIETESYVCEMLRKTELPIFMIAHRPKTIAIADRVLRLEKGLLSEVNNPYSVRD